MKVTMLKTMRSLTERKATILCRLWTPIRHLESACEGGTNAT
jgi:hypothetical protein